MQPYFAPYIGYFELMASVDLFVLLDDVQIPRRGWVHRNRFRSERKGNRWSYITLPLGVVSQKSRILDCSFIFPDGWSKGFLQRVMLNYGREACHHPVIKEICEWSKIGKIPVVEALHSHLGLFSACLGLDQRMILASSMPIDPGLKGEAKIIQVCRNLEADRYLNLPGGQELYDAEKFAAFGLELHFLPPTDYPHWSSCGVHLSVLDGLLSGELNRLGAHLEGYCV